MNRHQKACETVYQRGREAARAGLTEAACPYQDARNTRGGVTFGRTWRRTWLTGFRHERRSAKVPTPPKSAEKKEAAEHGKSEEKIRGKKSASRGEAGSGGADSAAANGA